MRRTRIKICGITRPQDALAAAEAGADAVGMVLHGSIKRLLTPQDAKAVIATLPPFVGAVGLFVNADAALIVNSARSSTAVQLHGNEPPELVAALAPLKVIKAISVLAPTVAGELQRWRSARLDNLIGLVMDAPGGGSGVANDWETLKRLIAAGDFADLPPWIAAGGLTAANVGAVIRDLKPWAVDISSGVESGPRTKSVELIQAFVRAVRQADNVA